MRKLILLLSILFLATCQQVTEKLLNKDWTLIVVDTPNSGSNIKGKEIAVDIPTVLHLDLLKEGLIEDPFFGDNYQKLSWVSDCNVKYTKKFNVEEENLERAIELVFKGIDTYSTVYLNGKEILKTENAFRQYVVRVDSLIKTENLLEIAIESTKNYDDKGQQTNSMPFKYAHTRKACYQYSWDWAPYLLTMGVWKDVQIRFFDEIRIDYVWARNKVLSPEEAVINFAVQLKLNLFKNEQLTEGYAMGVFLEGSKLAEKNIVEDTVYLDITIPNPRFWWPNGIGKPEIYDFEVRIMNRDVVLDTRKVPYGIRTVELNLLNKAFQVKVNGHAVYCKGGNYVPPDMFYPRLTNPSYQSGTTFKKLLDDAVESNFNMIRVWGGGQYESAEFYEMASRRGIMIFQDFMFSDSVYPSTADFLSNVEEEVKQQIRMIRNYPALAIWCGNNQILQGIQDWGWASTKYREDYHKLFQVLIKKILEIESPDIGYVPSSPVYGVGNYGFQRGGDFHYWGVWAGGSPFQAYESAVGPFNSQFGTQALPVWHTIKQFTTEEHRSYSSKVFLSHERHGSQFSTLKSYMTRYMKASKNFENQAYLSGLVQAFAMQIAIVAQRCAKPLSYGTLYWQFNDAWPAISWSAIDYYGRWKPLQFMAKRIYKNLAIFIDSKFNIIVINDYLDPINAEIKIEILDFDGKVLFERKDILSLDPDSKQILMKMDASIWQGHQKKSFIRCQISSSGIQSTSSTKYFSYFNQLQLPKATVTVKINEEDNTITFSTDKLVKNLFIDHKDKYLDLSDNYFDLVPNYPVVVTLQEGTLSNLKKGLIFNSVRQATGTNEDTLEVVIQ